MLCRCGGRAVVVSLFFIVAAGGGGRLAVVTSWTILSPTIFGIPTQRQSQVHDISRSGLSLLLGRRTPVVEDPNEAAAAAGQPFLRKDDSVEETYGRQNNKNNNVKKHHLLMNGTSPYVDLNRENKFDGDRPDASWNLAWSNFQRQSRSILQQTTEPLRGLFSRNHQSTLRLPDVLGLHLSNQAVTAAEERRMATTGGVANVHPVSQGLYVFGCAMLDTLFDERPIPRFWFLEVVARIPYFSYVSMLHLYESFGWWRAVELRKVHAAEEWNELHHLLIMESLGGNAIWSDRFLAYHAAILYYWLLILVFLASPRIAYQFMELLESHAVDTYTTFCQQNKDRLLSLPPPPVAVSYYASGDLYLFDDFQVSRAPGSRRPPCDSLYDVFCNIAIDEGEHVKTMAACQDYAVSGRRVVSPHVSHDGGGGGDQKSSSTLANAEMKRQLWKEWSEQMNILGSTEMDGF